MIHTPKNQTENKTYQWFNERQRLTNFYNSTPFYGGAFSETFYNTMKLAIPSIIQAAICGVSISVVVYKRDEDKAAYCLSASFKKKINRSECPYTGFITLSFMNH